MILISTSKYLISTAIVKWYDSKQNKNQESNNFYFGISDNVFIIPMGFIYE